MTEPPRRSVRSFVLRQGRVSNAQQRAWDTLFPKFGIPYTETPLDAEAVFGRSAPLILEIGSGMGETSVAIARAHPENDYIAVEVHLPGVGSLLKSIDEEGLANLRVIRHDAVDVLEKMVPDGSLAGLHVFFPDPWPKKRHNKRRIIQPPLVALAARKLAPGGYIHLATDWQAYAEHMLEVLSAEPLLENTAQDYAPRPAYRPQTKFEARGLRLGHGVWDLVFRRKA
ncbi:MAG: tRNA (guanosine(46)-N7)-methyltransferase TrmB [Proteobacteria bacterium]|nr:tRNA (guanosine(46)-N7)-methyltransferase TrmB [Pseudomonadota bacterium]